MTQTIGRYEILGLIGEGGMGQVLKAWDPKLGQHVALKVINPALLSSKKVMIRAQRELQVLLSLRSHPNIVTVLDYVEEPFALVMELLDGEELSDVIARNPSGLPLDVIYSVSTAIVGAVGFAHEKGILHRDMKPGNVMSMEFAQRQEIKVLDFGLAGFLSSDVKLTRTGARMGTPGYMAPEQHLGAKVDGRTDIYAMGVILYEMATGETPFKAHTDTDYQLMKAQLELPMPRPSQRRTDLPPALEEIILKATAREPIDRYQDAAEFLDDLKRAQFGESVDYGLRDRVEPSPTTRAPATIFEDTQLSDDDVFREPNRLWIWALVVLFAVGGLAAVLLLDNSQQEKLDQQNQEYRVKAEKLKKGEDRTRTHKRRNRVRAKEIESRRRAGVLHTKKLEEEKAAQARRAERLKEQEEAARIQKEDLEKRETELAEKQAAEEESKKLELERLAAQEAASGCASSYDYAGTWKLTTVVTETKSGRGHGAVGTNGFYTLSVSANGDNLSGTLTKHGYGKGQLTRTDNKSGSFYSSKTRYAGACFHEFSVDLDGSRGSNSQAMYLRKVGSELHGFWHYTNSAWKNGFRGKLRAMDAYAYPTMPTYRDLHPAVEQVVDQCTFSGNWDVTITCY